jgi:integrase
MKAKITKRLVDSLEPDPARDVLVWDTELAGFGLRVSRGGVKSYIFQYKFQRRARRITLGVHGRKLTLEAARKLALARRLAVQAGGDPATEAQEAAAAPTVRDLATRYLAEHAAKRSKSTQRSAAQFFRLFLIPALGSRKVASVTWADLEAIHQRLAYIPYQANGLLSLSSKAWSLAARWGWFPRDLASKAWSLAARWGWFPRDQPNPAHGHDRYPERARGQALDHEQLARLGAALDQEKPGSIGAAAFRFCLLTGCRPGEARTARWDSIDLAARLWKLPEAKTGPRAVYLGQAAVDVLAGLDRNGPFLFRGITPQAPLTQMHGLWERLVSRAELPKGVRLYDATRHTFATTAAELEVPRDVRKRLMGHAIGRDAHDRYLHPVKVLLRAADLVSGELAAALRGEETVASAA